MHSKWFCLATGCAFFGDRTFRLFVNHFSDVFTVFSFSFFLGGGWKRTWTSLKKLSFDFDVLIMIRPRFFVWFFWVRYCTTSTCSFSIHAMIINVFLCVICERGSIWWDGGWRSFRFDEKLFGAFEKLLKWFENFSIVLNETEKAM